MTLRAVALSPDDEFATPHATEAERLVVQFMVAHPACVPAILEAGFTPDLCFTHDYREVAKTVLNLFKAGVEPYWHIVQSALKSSDTRLDDPVSFQEFDAAVPRPNETGLKHFVGVLHDRARRRQLLVATTNLRAELADVDIPSEEAFQAFESVTSATRAADTASRLQAFSLAALKAQAFPQQRVLLTRASTPVFCAGHLGEIYSMRGVGKTWLAQSLALVVATGREAIGFSGTGNGCRVLYVDGEMAAEDIQSRFGRLEELLRIPSSPENLIVVGADWQPNFLPRLDTPEGQAALAPFIAKADLVILDNRSCLFDPEGEKDPGAWQPAQDWLLALRRRGKGVLLVHHANRQGGARGHSKPEDPMNLLLKLTRPDDYTQDQGARFIVEFDKARGIYGAAAAPFIAILTRDGWRVEPVKGAKDDHAEQKLREYLILANRANERPKSANDAIAKAKVNRNNGLRVWAWFVESGELVKDSKGRYYLLDREGEM